MDNGKIKIVIADDHAVLRESLSALLGYQPDFEVVGTAEDGLQTVEVIQQKHPDILVLDLFMPGSDGFDVLRNMERSGINVASVVLTASENQQDYVQVVRLGARGLVHKGDPPDRLFSAIRAVASGELAFGDEVAQSILNAMVHETHDEKPTNLNRLSERERQIAFLVARGRKNKDIAQELHISENTVKRHLQSIFGKTGAKDRLELAVLALTEVSKAA